MPKKLWLAVAVSIGFVLQIASAPAQTQTPGWSSPFRLSSALGRSSEGYCVADAYGYVHCFWTETLFADQRRIIQYSRFNGSTWSAPNSLYVTGLSITNISPIVDPDGNLHLAWAEGLTGPAYHMQAPVNGALAASSWSPPQRIDISARTLHLRLSATGTLHIVYVDQQREPGVYAIRSEDDGATWSEPVWLDPDILPNRMPDSLNFEIDSAGTLHAVWIYGSLTPSIRPDLVRYARSTDGGQHWSAPLTLDRDNPETDHNLTTASPVMIVQGLTVHVIWAAGPLPYRYHRYSTDGGQTWSAAQQVFGELHGQAFDSLSVDGAGRVHFFGQIRYPVAIYHAVWDQGVWSSPELVYLIAQEGEEIGSRIHAHHTRAVVRAGNQLVLTFADGPADPNRRLFAMYQTLGDIPSLEALPTPTRAAGTAPAASPTPVPATATPVATATRAVFDDAAPPVAPNAGPGAILQWALVPTVILLGVTLVVRWLQTTRS